LIFENVIFPDSAGFRCKNCGVCCRIQPPDIKKAEQKKIEARGFKNFSEHPDETGIAWIRRKKDDSCFFLSNNKCAIYDIRPAICRLEPFTIGDYDFSKNQIELILNFPFTSCCAGFCSEEELPVEEIAKAAQTMLQKILALTARDLGLQITDKRVHRETRSRLLRRTVEMADLKL
jgi:Fe-S-cluster containining protein